MANEDRWRNEERRWRDRDEDNRDWRGAGDDWRRGERWRGRESGFGDRDEWRRGERDFSRGESSRADRDDWRGGYGYGGTGYGGGSTGRDYGFRGDRDFGRESYSGREDYPSRSTFGGRYGGFNDVSGSGNRGWGSGSSGYERDFGEPPDYGSYFHDTSRSRYSGWGGEGYGRERNERGFLERASDEVASWFGDRDAERRREMDNRGRGPKSYTRSDDRIREDINDRLTDDPFVDAMEIEVSVSGSEATLTGTVATREQRRRAEDIAERISGVSHVQNNIRVRKEGTGAGGIGQTAFGRDTSAASGTSTTAGSTPVGAAGSSTAGTGTQRRTGTTS
jgi:osmotically-inducible protein OsmY